MLNRILLPVSPTVALHTVDLWQACRSQIQQVQHSLDPESYTDADPLKTLALSPDYIQHRYKHHRTSPLPRSRYSGYWGKVYGGDWDTSTVPVEKRSFYVSLDRVYNNGASWEETEQYRIWADRYSNEEALQRCKKIDDLKKSIESNGYLPQRTLVSNRSETFPLREPVVNIGRNGELIHFRDGNHRLCLAKFLGIENIVVRVGIRHAKWQRIRNIARESRTLPGSIPEKHPDLQDITRSD